MPLLKINSELNNPPVKAVLLYNDRFGFYSLIDIIYFCESNTNFMEIHDNTVKINPYYNLTVCVFDVLIESERKLQDYEYFDVEYTCSIRGKLGEIILLSENGLMHES